MKKSQSHKLVGEIGKIPDNIKAEIIVAGLLRAGILPDDLQLENVGTFSRPYRKDVVKVSSMERERGSHTLRLQFSRNGLYDLLPEALNHDQQLEGLSDGEQRSATEGYRRRKAEEAAARKFYRPFETEFFMQGVRLEEQEQALLSNPSAVFRQFLSDFWGVEGSVPHQYEGVLLLLLPYMHSIAGDFKKVVSCLEIILQIKVAWFSEFRTINYSSEMNQLGKGRLGESFILGSCVHAIPFLVFTFGPIEQERLADFLPGGEVNHFIKKFFSYALPLEMETEINFLSKPFQQKNGESSFGVLGFSAKV